MCSQKNFSHELKLAFLLAMFVLLFSSRLFAANENANSQREFFLQKHHVDLPISGGLGQDKNSPVIVHAKSIYEALQVENSYIRFLAEESSLYWSIRDVTSEKTDNGWLIRYDLISFNYTSSEWSKDHVDHSVYFLRNGDYKYIDVPLKRHVVFKDKRSNVKFYSSTPFVNFDSFHRYDDPKLGYDLSYKAPHFYANVYVYGESLDRDVVKEADRALNDVKSQRGDNTVENVRQAVCNPVECSYAYTVKNTDGANGFQSWIVVANLKGSYVKFRLTFPDTTEHKELAKKFVSKVKDNFLVARVGQSEKPEWWLNNSSARLITKSNHRGIPVEAFSTLAINPSSDSLSSILTFTNPQIFKMNGHKVSEALEKKMAEFSKDFLPQSPRIAVDRDGSINLKEMNAQFDQLVKKLKGNDASDPEITKRLSTAEVKDIFLEKAAEQWDLWTTPFQLRASGLKEGDSRELLSEINFSGVEVPVKHLITYPYPESGSLIHELVVKTTYDDQKLAQATFKFSKNMFKSDADFSDVKMHKEVVRRIRFSEPDSRPISFLVKETTKVDSPNEKPQSQQKINVTKIYWD